MGFGDILGQVLQDGMGNASRSSQRLNNTAGNLDRQGGGLDAIFGQFQDALSGGGGASSQAGGALGGFAEKARDFLQKDQIGGMSGAQVGGIGAVAGALLGGGLGGAARGGAMAVLGTLALGALKRAQGGGQGGQIAAEPHEVKELVGPEAEQLALRSMISAAKADGNIDRDEMQKIIGKISTDSVTAEEKQFVLDEMQRPVDISALASSARSPAQAAEVYAASLLAIEADSPAEQQYLRELASALNLDAATVAKLHELTGAPA